MVGLLIAQFDLISFDLMEIWTGWSLVGIGTFHGGKMGERVMFSCEVVMANRVLMPLIDVCRTKPARDCGTGTLKPPLMSYLTTIVVVSGDRWSRLGLA